MSAAEVAVSAEERAEMRATLRRVLEQRCDSDEVRRQLESDVGYDRGLWTELARTFGLAGLRAPERHGGAGFTMAETAMVAEELGRTLYGGPFLSHTLAIETILEAGTDEQHATLLPDLAGGERTAALAMTSPEGDATEDGSVRWRGQDGGVRLDGVASYVIDGHTAEQLVVAAAPAGSAETPRLFVVDATHLERRLLPTMDPTRKLAEIHFAATPASPLGDGHDTRSPLAAVLDRATLILAAEMLGGASRCLEMAVDYAKVRRQFGRTIGSFQAIKHKLADMLIAVESARSVIEHAATPGVGDDPEEAAYLASLAKVAACQAYELCAQDNIQIHGGIGFTWEHDAHLHLRRASSGRILLGTPEQHRERVTALLGVSTAKEQP